MEIFGFSAAKIITILIIAIVIFGPDKVPEMARTVGRTIRDIRRYMHAMTAEFSDATSGLREEFTGIAKEMKEELATTQADLRSQLDLTGIFAEAAGTNVSLATASPASHADAGRIAEMPSPAETTAASHRLTPSGDASVTAGARSTGRPTKAAPLADFAALSSAEAMPPGLPSRNGRHGAGTGGRDGANPARPEDTPSPPRPCHVGRSVTGTAYRRGSARPVTLRKGLCRSARVSHRPNIFRPTPSHATTAIAVAAPRGRRSGSPRPKRGRRSQS